MAWTYGSDSDWLVLLSKEERKQTDQNKESGARPGSVLLVRAGNNDSGVSSYPLDGY